MGFVKHIACEDCGSTDARAVYADGHHYCFSCPPNKQYKHCGEDTQPPKEQMSSKLDFYNDSTIAAIKDRGITAKTCEAYGVRINATQQHYPYFNEAGTLKAVKSRAVADKAFQIGGDFKDTLMFGQPLFPAGGKYITICEGELDAMAAYQMMGSAYPFISVRNGAQAALKDCKAQYEYLDSFDNIVLSFDTDEPGQAAAEKVAELFGPKVKIVKHRKGFKDACDYLKAGKGAEYNKDWWNAQPFTPAGIVGISDIRERMMTPPEPGIPWCFDALTKLTYGRRPGELYGFGAGVGIGKTDVFTQSIAYDLTVLNEPVGVIYLEQPVVETAQRVAGKMAGKLFHVPNPDGGWSQEDYVKAVDTLEAKQSLWLFEHFGAKDWESIKAKIRYLIKAKGCRMIYLDHLTALTANEQDERRALDAIMADMASFGQETGAIIHFISHLTTPEGKAHEEGGRVLEKHFTGSRAIARWSHYMFGLERNKQADDLEERQTTTFRVLKDRQTGRASGEKFFLRYDRDTGRLIEKSMDEAL